MYASGIDQAARTPSGFQTIETSVPCYVRTPVVLAPCVTHGVSGTSSTRRSTTQRNVSRVPRPKKIRASVRYYVHVGWACGTSKSMCVQPLTWCTSRGGSSSSGTRRGYTTCVWTAVVARTFKHAHCKRFVLLLRILERERGRTFRRFGRYAQENGLIFHGRPNHFLKLAEPQPVVLLDPGASGHARGQRRYWFPTRTLVGIREPEPLRVVVRVQPFQHRQRSSFGHGDKALSGRVLDTDAPFRGARHARHGRAGTCSEGYCKKSVSYF